MHRISHRLARPVLAVIALFAVVVGNCSAPAAASPPDVSSSARITFSLAKAPTRHSLGAALAYLPGKRSSGPNKNTKGQWATVSTMTPVRDSRGCPTGRYRPKLTLHDSRAIAEDAALPQRVAAAPRPAAGACPVIAPSPGAPGDAAQPSIAWNPFDWDWGNILGKVWSGIWNNCLKGATSGLVGTAGTTLVVNLLSRGAMLYLGPQGYAAVAIGACFANFLW